MLLAKGKIGKVTILRPGALGDVLAVRGVIAFCRRFFPGAEVCLLAPGERGEFLARDGWAHRCFDWERAAFSWLFSDGHAPPPSVLRAVFRGTDLILSFVDFPDPDALGLFEARLADLAPAAGTVFCPSRPPAGEPVPIGEWLARAVAGFAGRYGLLPRDVADAVPGLAASRIRLPDGTEMLRAYGLEPRCYAVLHPGSGSRDKNWPLDKYIALAKLLASRTDAGADVGAAGLRLAVTSGEADGDLGRRLAEAVGGAAQVHSPRLAELAVILANARLYVGNDSGVSHLAAAVERADGGRPAMAALFGPSDPRVWSPPGAAVLSSGGEIGGVPLAAVWSVVDELLRTPEKS